MNENVLRAVVNKVNKMLKMLFLYFSDNVFTIYIKFSLGLNPPRNERERERNVSKQQQTRQETEAVLDKQREAVSRGWSSVRQAERSC